MTRIERKGRSYVVNRLFICVGVFILGAGLAIAEQELGAEVDDQQEHVESFGKNIRLDFMMVPLENDDKGVYIVTASPYYETSVQFEGDEGRVAFGVSGEVAIRDDGRIFVVYEATMQFKGHEGEGEFNASSSVILKLGQKVGVARMGDKTLTIRASYVDSNQ